MLEFREADWISSLLLDAITYHNTIAYDNAHLLPQFLWLRVWVWFLKFLPWSFTKILIKGRASCEILTVGSSIFQFHIVAGRAQLLLGN